MDLNYLYFKHQISMMRMSSAEDTQARNYHQIMADGFSRRIARLQRKSGARAETPWNAQGQIR